ncbi:MAG: DUF456 domain-containing protein [Actinobacteria bacterium]|nr:DUF456 domain-containing protein [Actinomycetota bacterium]
MTTDIIVSVAAGVLLAVAVFGTVFPILPGSPVALVTLIGWGWVLGSAASWTAAGIGAFLCLIGWSASMLLAGRRLKKQRIPKRSVLIGVLGGIVGMFVLPFAGLFLGFAAGLFVSECAGRRDLKVAARASLETLKAMGLGMVVEFLTVSLAGSVWTIGMIVHFAT